MGPRYSFKASADADGSMCFGENGVTPSTNDVTCSEKRRSELTKHDLWPYLYVVRHMQHTRYCKTTTNTSIPNS